MYLKILKVFYLCFVNTQYIFATDYNILLRRSGRAVTVYLYSTAHKTQLTIYNWRLLEDFLHTSLFPDLLPQPIGGFINNIFWELNATT
jgi:hypothetical protein